MGEANEGGRRSSKGMENLSLQMDKYPRDLLQRFLSSSNTQQSQYSEPHKESQEIELNLGLSLGGQFGVDKNAKKLMRSSSIVGTMPLLRETESTTPTPASHPTLMRTSSLPTETEEMWRKRKELQTLRRMEAKRRRSEKQRNFKAEGDGGSGGGGVFEDERREFQGVSGLNLRDKRFGSMGSAPFGLPGLAACAAVATSTRPVVLGDVFAKGEVGLLGGTAGFMGFGQPSSRGSADSRGGSSSGMSEFESKPFPGSSSCGAVRSPTSSNQLLQDRCNQEAVGSSGTKTNEYVIRTSRTELENPSNKPDSGQNRGREFGTNSMGDMPCVFTKGNGPNGRRIEGILYKYGKGEEVRIMCVCHGDFLSPAEFVKHAGGGDVAHPLRHIVVNPSSASFCGGVTHVLQQ